MIIRLMKKDTTSIAMIENVSFFDLSEQRAKAHACMRPWRLPRYLEKPAERVSHSSVKSSQKVMLCC